MFGHRTLPGLLAASLLVIPVTGMTRDDPLVQRVERLERMLDSRSMLEMLNRIDQLQREVQQLRGDLELQTNTLNSLQQRQRELYLDIDRRLHRLEAGGVAAPPELPGAVPGETPAPMPPTGGLDTASPAGEVADGELGMEGLKERDAYEQALEVLKEGRYEEAAKAFRVFRSSYPASRYAANAQYWLGEAYYVTRDFDTALKEFNQVLEEFPTSNKVADARLKIGFIRYERKEWDLARQALEEVVSRFPDSTAARLARDRLQRMSQEGH